MGIKTMAILLLEIILTIIGYGVLANENLQNNNAVKSIQSEDGDIIDCIDIYKQPALNHPALKNHKIQLKPSNVPTRDITSKANSTKSPQRMKGDMPLLVTKQLWQRSGSCPDGTVPIRRMSRNSEHEARKPSSFFHPSKRFNTSAEINLFLANHSLSVLHTEGYAYIGAKGEITVWHPPVELDDEYTTSQVSLKSGPHHDFEEIESGWTVNPRVYKDRNTRLFVYWTADASRNTGCFDHFCPGFVQVSKEIALGATLDPISSPNAQPAAFVSVYIFKDPKTGNWWVNYAEKTNVGYWPGNLFKLLNHHAETVQWGGEVYSSKVATHPHTATGMGSGDYAFVGFNSGVIKRIRILDNSMVLKFPEYAASFSDEINCYDYFLYRDIPDPEFYYGGPGRNWKCP